MTADGKIRPCLFSETEVSVGDLLRNKAADEEIIAAIREAVRIKPAGNQFRNQPFQILNQNTPEQDEALRTQVVMRGIGG